MNLHIIYKFLSFYLQKKKKKVHTIMVRIHTVVHEYNKTAWRDNNNFWFISFLLSNDLKKNISVQHGTPFKIWTMFEYCTSTGRPFLKFSRKFLETLIHALFLATFKQLFWNTILDIRYCVRRHALGIS